MWFCHPLHHFAVVANLYYSIYNILLYCISYHTVFYRKVLGLLSESIVHFISNSEVCTNEITLKNHSQNKCFSEFYFPLPEAWHETRGLHMIVAMKIISVAFDMKKGTIKTLLGPVEYYGYMLCPSNCLFGPWISLHTYRSAFNCNTPLFVCI